MTDFTRVDWAAERTDEQWEALAVEMEQAQAKMYASREESWQRCDTDGFMSQWALGVSAGGYHAAAALARAHGTTDTTALFFLDGRVASTHFKWGQYGPYWVLNDEATAYYGRRFLNESRARTAARRAMALGAKGFAVGWIRVRASIRAPHAASAVNVHYGIYADVSALKACEYQVISTTGGDAVDY